MHRLNEIVSKLSPAQLREVENFAEFLASKRGTDATPDARFLNVEIVAGMLDALDPGKSSVDLVHEEMQQWAAKYDHKPA
jgi:hypothetical protein